MAATACFALAAAPASALTVKERVELDAQIKRLEKSLKDPAMLSRSVPELVEAAGLSGFVAPIPAAGLPDQPMLPTFAPAGNAAAGPPEAQRLNMRLALTMISQAYGPDDNADVLAAQPAADLDALVIRSGTASLADVRALLQQFQLQPVSAQGPLTLQVPLVIWSGAELKLLPGDVLNLSRPDGAFVMNFGHLDMSGAAIDVAGGANPRSAVFMPFVTSADGGSVNIRGARLTGLGFGITQKFAGFSIMRNGLRVVLRESRIENSSFRDLRSVAISAASDVVVLGNRFYDMRGAALVVARSRDVRILGNVFFGKMPTNAILLEEGSARAVISGNVLLGGKRAGIVVRSGSRFAEVARNIIWRRDGGGIALVRSDCGRISGNMVLFNRQKGVEVRFAQGAEVRQNTLISNHSAGVWISAQPDGTETFLGNNILAGNGSGLAAARGGEITLDGNDFTGQFPLFVSGDLATQSEVIAGNLRGEQPMVLGAARRGPPAPAAMVCAD